MRNIIILISTFYFLTSHAQDSTAILQPDPPEVVDKTTTMNELIQQRNDSLERELLYYRAKEDYFAAALSEQSTRFTLIITSLLTLAALVSIGGYVFKLRQLERKMDRSVAELDNKMKNLSNEAKKLNASVLKNSYNTFTVLSHDLMEKKRFFDAFMIFLMASREDAKAVEFLEESQIDYKKIAENLKHAEDALIKGKDAGHTPNLLLNFKEKVIAAIEIIEVIPDPEVKNIAAHIRVEYLKVIRVTKEAEEESVKQSL